MIHSFLLNLFLAVVFVALQGSVSFLNLLAGMVIGAVIVSVINRTFGNSVYLGRIAALLRFCLYFFGILFKANIQVAKIVLSPGLRMSPRVVRYPIHNLNELQFTTLANAITLTPGTLSADIDAEHRFLYIHCMDAPDRGRAIADIDELRDRLLREVFPNG